MFGLYSIHEFGFFDHLASAGVFFWNLSQIPINIGLEMLKTLGGGLHLGAGGLYIFWRGFIDKSRVDVNPCFGEIKSQAKSQNRVSQEPL